MTSLEAWAENGWLQRHEATREEGDNLIAIVDREIQDARVPGLSLDAQLGMLYNAALKLIDIALRLYGYRADRANAHYRTITSLPLTLGADWAESAKFINHIRSLRHRGDYESVGIATRDEVRDIHAEIQRLRPRIEQLVEERLG